MFDAREAMRALAAIRARLDALVVPEAILEEPRPVVPALGVEDFADYYAREQEVLSLVQVRAAPSCVYLCAYVVPVSCRVCVPFLCLWRCAIGLLLVPFEFCL